MPRSSKEYWGRVKELIDSAGDYAAAIKLWANLIDESTAFKVRPVLEKYYDGNIANLEDAIKVREEIFYGKVVKVNILCRQYGLIPITKPEVLLSILLDSKKRESFKGKMNRRLEKDRICNLQEFVGYNPNPKPKAKKHEEQ